MPRNGSGTYSLLSNGWNPATNGNAATAADWQSLINDVAAAITQSLSADGQTPMTGNLNLGGNKATNLAAGVAAGESLRWQQLFSQGVEADVASAATVDIGAQNTNFLRITGTTTITSFGTNYNGPRFVRFGAALTLTHNATTLILPTAANITTAAGDRAILTPVGNPASGWQVLAYQRADGSPLVPAQAANSGTTSGTGTAYTLTPTTAITSYTANQTFWVTFHAASGASPTLQISGVASPPSLVRYNSAGALVNIAAGELPANFASRVTLLSATQALVEELPPGTGSVLRGFLAGLTMSTAGASTTMSISAGQATDSTNAVLMALAASINKTTSAWAVGSGNGGLDTGAIANNTWYHFHLIRRPDTGEVDVLFSLSASSPTLPANYTQFRRIGSGRTNGSGQWTRFFQDGDLFNWDVTASDVASGTLSTASRTLVTVSVPSGVNVVGLFGVTLVSSGSAARAILSDPATTDTAAGNANAMFGTSAAATGINTGYAQCRSNTSSQIGVRGDAALTYHLNTFGWIDSRGRSA